MDFFDILLAKKLEDDRDPTIEGLSVTENGIYSKENKAYNPVIVEVPEPTLVTKSITANGTYTASADNADGYSQVTVAVPQRVNVYGFHINGNESNPSAMVTYLEDAIGMTPAHMDYTNDVFDYGSWQDAFFMPRPCILGQNGTVIKYLNPNDYTKDTDGNTVVIDENLTDANVMIEFPKMWYKVVADANDNYSGSVYIANAKLDEGYKDWAYIDYQGVHKDHFYMPAYSGSLVDSTLRSINGAQVMKSKTAAEEITYATANGNGWYTEDFGEIQLINFLLILMGKSTNTQTVFGQGIHTGGNETFNDGFRTGVHNTKGLFYGTNSGSASYTNAVKVFGIENWWGLQLRRYAGHMFVDGMQKIKLCYGQEDGSTVNGYNTDGTGYAVKGNTPSGTSGGYINKMTYTNGVMLPSATGGSASTYYCDVLWYTNTSIGYASRGGSSGGGSPVGAFFTAADVGAAATRWNIGAAVSYK